MRKVHHISDITFHPYFIGKFICNIEGMFAVFVVCNVGYIIGGMVVCDIILMLIYLCKPTVHTTIFALRQLLSIISSIYILSQPIAT